MKPETIQIIIGKWNSSNDTTRNVLMRLFLENNGDFSYQQEWLLFLAEAFQISNNFPIEQVLQNTDH